MHLKRKIWLALLAVLCIFGLTIAVSADDSEIETAEPVEAVVTNLPADAPELEPPEAVVDGHTTVQHKAHAIAELARAMDLAEDHTIIVLAQSIWHAEEAEQLAKIETILNLYATNDPEERPAADVDAVDTTDDTDVADADPFVVPRTSVQAMAHEIAESARALGEEETSPLITLSQEIWFEEEADNLAEYERRVAEYQRSVRHDFFYSSGTILPYEITYDPDFEEAAVAIAKVMYGEARGEALLDQLAALAWEVVNRANYYQGTIYFGALTYWAKDSGHFAYNEYLPTVSDYGIDLVALSRDVIYRAKCEDQGETDVGRVLPSGMWQWHTGNHPDHHNWFRNAYEYPFEYWDFSWENPYSGYYWYIEQGLA